jgi:hypothetical protein
MVAKICPDSGHKLLHHGDNHGRNSVDDRRNRTSGQSKSIGYWSTGFGIGKEKNGQASGKLFVNAIQGCHLAFFVAQIKQNAYFQTVFNLQNCLAIWPFLNDEENNFPSLFAVVMFQINLESANTNTTH